MRRTHISRAWLGATLGIATAVAAFAVLLPSECWAQGCAMCATYLSNGKDPRAEAFKISIMFLMAMPFVVVGTAGGWIGWMYWRSRRTADTEPALEAESEGAS